MSADDVRRAVTRIAHEILERQRGGSQLVLVGLQRGGAWLADAIGAAIDAIEPAARVPVGYIDVSMHRDDIGLRPVVPGAISRIDFAIDGVTVVLVDDVLYTGRTVRAALEASTPTAVLALCNSRCSSTAAIANCRSAPTMSERTCRRTLTTTCARPPTA